MSRLAKTVQQLSMARNLEEIMHIVRTVARQLTGADGATFVLRDGNLCYYADEDAISPLWKGSRFPMETCISGWAMINKTPALIEDIYADTRIPHAAYKPTFVKSLAMVPIRTLDPIGAIGNYWATPHKPTPEEVSMLQALADITAVSIENIQVRNTLEEKVKERTQELVEYLGKEKHLNEMKSAFVSMASHEFRTPLSAILSSVSLAEKYVDTSQQDKREKHYARIKTSVRNLVELLDDFLSLEKLQQGKVDTEKETFDLEVFLLELFNDLDGIRKVDQVIEHSYTGEHSVFLNKKTLRNIMLNLLSNALKYSQKNVIVHTHVSPNEITIRVEDHGIGIPKDQQQNLFKKFFRAANTGNIQGTGLGLSIVKHYAELLSASIGLVSEENKGTTFTLVIPREAKVPNRAERVN
jgi:signal transduction histidine kinase